MTLTTADLRQLTLEQLAEMFGDAGDELRQSITAECDRRDRADRARRRRRADPETVAWREAAHAQLMAAEAECNGYLVNNRGRAAGIDPWSLWSGPMWQAERYASWELLRYWEQHPRCTVTEYRRQAAAARDAEIDELDRARHELPDARELVAMVREHGPGALNRYCPESGIDEMLSTSEAAEWVGVQARTIHRDRHRGRWPEADLTVGPSLAWKRRTIIVALAARTGRGAPGKERAKRKAS